MAALSGCAYNVPLVVDPAKDMAASMPGAKRMPLKVGVYISDDLKRYVYTQQKMGMTFQMKAGEYLPDIVMNMASTLFEDAVPVNSLPPYNDIYRPDVEAILIPEILFSYGNAVGTLYGFIEAKIKLRISAFDLGGELLWQDEAVGESRSKDLDFVSTFLGGMEDVGKAGYDAAFSATIKIIKNFYARSPQDIYALLESKSAERLNNRGGASKLEMFKKFYLRGQSRYDKKKYYQAIYSFEKALSLVPDDSSALFYIAACHARVGEKDRALKKFGELVGVKYSKQAARDARKWMDTLKKPLKLAVLRANASSDSVLSNALVRDAMIASRMYEVMDVADLMPTINDATSIKFKQFLGKCYKKGVRVILVYDIDDSSRKVQPSESSGEDVATEYSVKILAKAYSAKTKGVKAEISINEKTSTIMDLAVEDEMAIKHRLLKSGADKLVLQLLANDIL
jgi:tetratricopeptide (TPR) repeat protein